MNSHLELGVRADRTCEALRQSNEPPASLIVFPPALATVADYCFSRGADFKGGERRRCSSDQMKGWQADEEQTSWWVSASGRANCLFVWHGLRPMGRDERKKPLPFRLFTSPSKAPSTWRQRASSRSKGAGVGAGLERVAVAVSHPSERQKQFPQTPNAKRCRLLVLNKRRQEIDHL